LFILGVAFSSNNKINREIKENLIGIGAVGSALMLFGGWLLLFATGTAYTKYTIIPNDNIQVHKTSIAYVVDFDKEETVNYITLEDCSLLDQKETLYFYKVSPRNFYNQDVGKEKYIFLRKPYATEQKEN
jgi:hypothetical protein